MARRRNQLGQAMGAKGIQTRRRLLDATEALLNTTSLRDLRVAQIVRLANTSAATFYVYFNDVSEAVLALIGEFTQSPPRLLALVGEPWRGEAALDRAHDFVAAYMEHWQSHAAAFRVRNLASDEGDERFLHLRLAAVSPLLGAIAAQIEARQASGRLPADLQPQSTAAALLAMIERIAVVSLDWSPSGVSRPRLLQVAAFFALLLLGEDWDAPVVMKRLPRGGRGPGGLERAQGALQSQAKDAPTQLNLHGQAMGAKGSRTRQRIMEATGSLLQTCSLVDLSVADIAKTAQISTSTFYLYFQDVPEALLAVIGEVKQSTPELIDLLKGDWDRPDRHERAFAFVKQYIEHWRNNRAIFRARNLVADEGDDRFVRARAESVTLLMRLLEQRIAAVQAQGGLPAELFPAAAAGGFLAMIERLATTPSIPNVSGVTVDTVSRSAAYFLTVLMHGYPP